MKRFVILLFSVLAAIVGLHAQNANRNGFFLELGIGGMVGDNIRTSITIDDNVVKAKGLSGASGDIGLGFRKKLGRHWAYELKAEGMFPFESLPYSIAGRLLPIGFRYTSVEVWRNYSLYFHFNAGGVISATTGEFPNSWDSILVPGENKIEGFGERQGFGGAYSLGVGANLTTHFYAEACWNGQVLINCFGKNGKCSTLNGGTFGLIIGYRF